MLEQSAEPVSVIIDTDVGGDPDDIIALQLALHSPEISVELIVTSDEHEGHRARFVREFLRAKGLDIPVVQGADLGNAKYCHVCRSGGAAQNDIDTDVVGAVMKVLRQKPQTRYVCIAPQSNLAAVLDTLGEEAEMLHVLMMGGAVEYRRKDVAEYNIRHDIEAARNVFASAAQLTYVISDTTFTPEIEITAEHPIFQRLAASVEPHHRMIVENCRAFFAAKYASTIMHDPLTISTLLRNNIVRFRDAELVMNGIGQMSENRFGKTVRISCSANYAAFMALIAERL